MLLHRFLTEQKIEWRKGMEMCSSESIKQGVMAGLGIAFISAHTIAVEVEEERLAVLDVAGTPLVRHWYLVRLQEKTTSSQPRFLGISRKKLSGISPKAIKLPTWLQYSEPR